MFDLPRNRIALRLDFRSKTRRGFPAPSPLVEDGRNKQFALTLALN